jgi:hypothetical protein
MFEKNEVKLFYIFQKKRNFLPARRFFYQRLFLIIMGGEKYPADFRSLQAGPCGTLLPPSSPGKMIDFLP